MHLLSVYNIGDFIRYKPLSGRGGDVGIVKRIESDRIYCIWLNDIKKGNYSERWVSEKYISYKVVLVTTEEKEKYLDLFMVEML